LNEVPRSLGESEFDLPVEDPMRPMPEPARDLLRAARRLLREGGYDALRLDAIVREADKNKASVKYYFGNKEGLIAALVDSLDHEQCVALAERARNTGGEEERLEYYIEGHEELICDADANLAFYDLLPHILRDERLRGNLARTYEWYYQIELARLGLSDRVDQENKDDMLALAALLAATVDGLALQQLLKPPRFDLQRSLRVLEHFLRRCGEDFVRNPELKKDATGVG